MIRVVEGSRSRTLLLDRPERANSLTVADWEYLCGLVEQADTDPAVDTVVVRGVGGRHFSAGMDLAELQEARCDGARARRLTAAVTSALAALTFCATPTVAVIDGAAVGGGAEIALAAALRVAASTANFALPMARIGVSIDEGSLHNLVGLVGHGLATDLLLTGRTLSAEEAQAAGLFQQVVPPEHLGAALDHVLAAVTAGDPVTQQRMRRMLAASAPRPAASWAEPMNASLIVPSVAPATD